MTEQLCHVTVTAAQSHSDLAAQKALVIQLLGNFALPIQATAFPVVDYNLGTVDSCNSLARTRETFGNRGEKSKPEPTLKPTSLSFSGSSGFRVGRTRPRERLRCPKTGPKRETARSRLSLESWLFPECSGDPHESQQTQN